MTKKPDEGESAVVALPLASTSSTTLSEVIRTALADEITAGELEPGAEIDEQEVARRFGVSRTPVREALRELAATGLVSIEPRRGVRVVSLTLDKLGEMFEVMAEIEAICVRTATHRMTSTERLALLLLHRKSLDAVRNCNINLYDQMNQQFHSAIYRGTHNSFLESHAAALRLRLAPFRRAQFHGSQRLRQSYAEHEGLIIQVHRGDGDEAARLMRAHMSTASVVLAEYMSDGHVPRPAAGG
ncbi:MAG TPA: GntR family transcriptional regulator [Acetobacteraceae bacterium]